MAEQKYLPERFRRTAGRDDRPVAATRPKRGSGDEKCQPACKPGSVSGMTAGRPFLWDDPCGPPLATYPNDRPGEGWRPVLRRTDRVVPIRSCSRWGLPCRRCCQRRGGLLPHRFTLTPPALRLRRASSRGAALQAGRSVFCGTFPGITPAGRYPAPFLRGARTFLPRRLSTCDGSGRPAGWRPLRVPHGRRSQRLIVIGRAAPAHSGALAASFASALGGSANSATKRSATALSPVTVSAPSASSAASGTLP